MQNTLQENSPQDVWQLLSGLCQAEGVSLFDIEVPGIRGTGVLRVYIHTEGGVQHAHCAGVSHRILNHPQVESILPGSTLLEVSSPGVNRKLTREEHFVGAIGERVKVSYRPQDGKKISVIGELKSAIDKKILVEVTKEKTKTVETLTIPLAEVSEARVDFLFK